MSARFVPNAILARSPDGPVALVDHLSEPRLPIPRPWLAPLEAALHDPTSGSTAARPARVDERIDRASRAVLAGGLILVSARGLRVLPGGLSDPEGHITLTRASAARGDLLPALLGEDPLTLDEQRVGEAAVAELRARGLLVPAPNEVAWGDLRRAEPLCAVFGNGRGTPIDRHYLDRFVADHRDAISGDTVALGGHRGDRVRFGLRGVRSFQVVDLSDRHDVDVVGDLHDPSLLPEASCDTVLAFNVLEHCRDPRVVLRNAHRWLRPGGRALVMVPSAQRLHAAPDDYWRFSPAGLALLFDGWREVAPRSYGNLTTVLASHLGVAAEELTDDELDLVQADHPVATCAVAIA